MTDLNENATFDEILGDSNMDTQEQSSVETVSESDAEIDAINEVLAEAESGPTIAENETVEPVGNNDRFFQQFGNSEQLEEPSEPEPLPWADAPENTIYYEKLYEDGHLGSFTESPEMAYKFGWYENRISKDDVKQSDINGWTYIKDKCPMKTADDISRDEAKARIFELKNFLAATDYKAIKYAEGALTADEYEPDRQARAGARTEINRLEASV